MSTVLPPAAALPLLVALVPLLLLLLLQPTAAKAIAVKAAMAVVRLMIFLSSFEVVRLPRSDVTGLVWARGLAEAGDGRSDDVPYGGPAALGVGSGQDPGPGERRRRHLSRRFPHPGAEPT
jgi:hypothetical protein